MQEVEKEVKTFLINMLCDCEKGFLILTGKFKPAIASGEMLHVHKCTKCGKLFDLKKRYPLHKYETVDGDS